MAYRADEAFIVGVMSVFRTYAANGKQYIAVLTAMGMMSGGLMDRAGIKPIAPKTRSTSSGCPIGPRIPG